MTAFISLSQSDIFSSSSSLHYNNNYNNDNNSQAFQDYETVSTNDLFQFSEPNYFKEVVGRRAYLIQKNRDHAAQNYLLRKVKQGAATVQEQQAIREKWSQRRRGDSNSDSDSDSNSSSDNASVTESETEHSTNKKQQQQKQERKQLSKKASNDSGFLSSASVSSSSNKNKNKNKNGDRSNKRADRHRRPEDEVYSEPESDSQENNGYQSYSDNHEKGASEGEEEERIRFKHNLNFKTDDDEAMPGQKLDSKEWKQIFVQKLEQQQQQQQKMQKKFKKQGKGSKSQLHYL
ncbi:hypothetical protein BGZ80_002966 [Entomortierella chlamydospora]|uniref:Uncharacterized protein n=1 Tax=Entomortierella chlamydospora TaxID=101097 RepID=A0A9P6T2Z4_9FUNG|nr:hypothetical protein BGZ79_003560 [Entomortierella chlamydospora]KAG0021142.1 hypothetical protein BGZ80_002966 [Entomortierella chlamydospora]